MATRSDLFSKLTRLDTTKFIVYCENQDETTDVACEMFTPGCSPWLKNVAWLSSQLFLFLFLVFGIGRRECGLIIFQIITPRSRGLQAWTSSMRMT